jgi:plastocyanin
MSREITVSILSLATVGVAAAVAVVSCSTHEPAAPYRAPAECALAGEPAPGATRAYVAMRGFAFSPDTIHVAAGTAVTWVNCETPDIDAHTATAGGGAWDSGYLASGAAYTHTFDAAGSFGYACIPHPFMRGAVVVR